MKRVMGVAVDLAVFTVMKRRLHVLLIRMKRAPFTGRWALPGGRLRSDETVEEAAARELTEKTGLAHARLEQLYTFSAPGRDPDDRCVSVLHLALLPATAQLRTTDKYSAIGWFPADRLPPLAFDHRDMLRVAVRRLRAELLHSSIAAGLLDGDFTLGELQRACEAILGAPLDPRNFQRRVLDQVVETGKLRGGAHRPARLYRFSARRAAGDDA
jgi:8-oxo-dGTP diphosphatase